MQNQSWANQGSKKVKSMREEMGVFPKIRNM